MYYHLEKNKVFIYGRAIKIQQYWLLISSTIPDCIPDVIPTYDGAGI